MVGNTAKPRNRNRLHRPQQPPGVTESAELQRETELIRVATAALHGSPVGGAQRPVSDQHGFAGSQGEQLLELLVGEDAASRHSRLSQVVGRARSVQCRPEQDQGIAAGLSKTPFSEESRAAPSFPIQSCLSCYRARFMA